MQSLKLLHISDLHLGPPYLPVVGDALVRKAAELKADVTVASGDFTQRAKPRQFADARALVDRLPRVPLVVVPGNHDVALWRIVERVFWPYANYRRYLSPELDTVLVRDDSVIVALNTTAPLTAVTNGRIRPRQLELCRRALADVPPEKMKIVVAHHHFAPAPDYDSENDVMWRAREALELFADLNVDLILGGHLHRAYIGNSLDIYPAGHRASGIIIAQCGTSTSRRGRAREREKNSFNWIEIDTDTIRITQFMYFKEQDAFEPLSRHVFPRRGRKYLSNAT